MPNATFVEVKYNPVNRRYYAMEYKQAKEVIKVRYSKDEYERRAYAQEALVEKVIKFGKWYTF